MQISFEISFYKIDKSYLFCKKAAKIFYNQSLSNRPYFCTQQVGLLELSSF